MNTRPRRERHHFWTGGHSTVNGYKTTKVDGHPRGGKRGYVFDHILVVEAAMGKYLREGTEVHHVDRTKTNNANNNIVACHDIAYHQLLHRRQRALDACGDANWLMCTYCKQWGPPSDVFQRSNRPSAYHQTCNARYYRERARRIREQVS